jgi:prevent-host-death family protein
LAAEGWQHHRDRSELLRYDVTMLHDHGSMSMEATIGAGDFKAKCLQLLDDVATRREPLIITKRGKPVARLVPVRPDTQLFGALAGSVLDEADIVAPVDAGWDAAR